MDFTIKPLKGVNDIEFGMRPEQVRSRIGADFEIDEHRTKDKNYPSDFYVEKGLFCDYDSEGHLETIEFVLSGRPFLAGVNLLSVSVATATAMLARLDPQLIVESDGATSVSQSMAIWSSEASDDDKDVRVEAFLVGRSGYYNFML